MADIQRISSSPVELPVIVRADRERLLTGLLRGVSRTFYLTLRVLPKRLREPVGLAYLLARAADTIADTRLLPPQERLGHLLAFRSLVEGPATMRALQEIGAALTDKQSRADERALLTALPEAFSLLEALSEEDRTRVRSVVVTLTRGMETDLTIFPQEDSGRLVAFKDLEELDSYTYYVAGCVGEFWTTITMAHTPALREWDAGYMSETGVRFGKALQLTNVLRDVPRDLRIGRCYLPETELARVGLTPEELLSPLSGDKARPVLVAGIEVALEHYRAAEEYLLSIPGRCLRLRLAVLWPLLIGLATLSRLAYNEAWLDPSRPSKVSRGWVYRTMALSLPCVSSDRLLRAWIARLRKQVETAL
ncbi:MAG: squalene/phytoene synthase family protein [Dehalococcoidia bacterium]|nr:squalene/phytoene synthase family protein [Dehalococcoidia bacterium]